MNLYGHNENNERQQLWNVFDRNGNSMIVSVIKDGNRIICMYEFVKWLA